jgi:hypothetical protein
MPARLEPTESFETIITLQNSLGGFWWYIEDSSLEANFNTSRGKISENID